MELNQYIDHTILKHTSVDRDIEKLCHEAKSHGFYAVCVPPNFVAMSKELLKDHDTKVDTVIGFPFGYSHLKAKEIEISQAIIDGADELDVVINISNIKNDKWAEVKNEIEVLQNLIKSHNKTSKFIIESGILSDKEIMLCCQYCNEFNVDYVKTSTGYAESGASIRAVKLMKEHLSPSIKVKASGGIRNYQNAIDLINAGADRLGTSASVTIMNGAKKHA